MRFITSSCGICSNASLVELADRADWTGVADFLTAENMNALASATGVFVCGAIQG
jgi:hypothetical protein